MINTIYWLSDLHLDFTDQNKLQRLFASLQIEPYSALVISGDISGRGKLSEHLEWVSQLSPLPVYFILGNHDFYHFTFKGTYEKARQACEQFPNLHHIQELGVVPLNSSWAMVGHHGWGDGRAGLGIKTKVVINDSIYIHDLRNYYKPELWNEMNRLGTESACYMEEYLEIAIQTHDHVLIMTHVPPFPETAWHLGLISCADYLPHMCNLAMGETLRKFALTHPDKDLVVLCGHTHSPGTVTLLPNLKIFTASAEYGSPTIQQCFQLGTI